MFNVNLPAIFIIAIMASSISPLSMAADPAPTPPEKNNVEPDNRVDAPGSGGAFFSRFEQLDTNSDGFLDRDEALKSPQLKADFDLIDANSDKTISRAEWNTYRNIRR